MRIPISTETNLSGCVETGESKEKESPKICAVFFDIRIAALSI